MVKKIALALCVLAALAPAATFAVSQVIIVPASLGPDLSQNVGDTLGTEGAVKLIALVAGVPLFFAIVWYLLDLLPDASRDQLKRLREKYP